MTTENFQHEARLMQNFQAHVLNGASDIVAEIAGCVATANTGAEDNAYAESRLAIYANAYRSRLQEVLATDYPALQVLAGDDLFAQLSLAYVAAHPSTSPNARWFGASLPKFLSTEDPFAAHSVLAEMAEFEWAMSLAFDSPNDRVIALDELAVLTGNAWPTLQFRVHSSVHRLKTRWNVAAFWQSVQDDHDAPPLLQSEMRTNWIVWRRGHSVYFRSLADDESWALDSVLAGATFATLCEGLCDWNEPATVAARAVEILRQWIADEMISELRLPP